MSEFNFKSQICTSLEQSERLLELGLKKETADMVYTYEREEHGDNYYWNLEVLEGPWDSFIWPSTCTYIPAWSLHRLIEMIPEYFADTKLEFRIEAIKWLMQREGNIYDNLVILITDCIKHDIFNKEYLEE